MFKREYEKQMKNTRILNDRYEWVVMGDHPVALLSGAIAAKLGFSTLILLEPNSKGRSHQVRFSYRGQCLDPEGALMVGASNPEMNRGILPLVFQKLNILLPSTSGFSTGNFFLPQVITDSIRICEKNDDLVSTYEWKRELNLSASVSARLMELKNLAFEALINWGLKECAGVFEKSTLEDLHSKAGVSSKSKKIPKPKPKSRFAGDWLNLDSDFSKQWQSLRAQVPELLEVLKGQASAYGISQFTAENIEQVAITLGSSKASYAYTGGWKKFRQFLIQVATDSGAHVYLENECRRIFLERNRPIGFQLANQGKMIGVDYLILGCGSNSFLELASNLSASDLQVWENRLSPVVGWVFSLALTVHEEAIPVGMNGLASWVEKDAPDLWFEVHTTEEYQLGKTKDKLLFVRTILPFEEESLSISYQLDRASKMFQKLQELFPFLQYHVGNVFPDFRRAENALQDPEAKESFGQAYGFTSLDQIPDNLLRRSGRGSGPLTSIDQVYRLNNEAYPDYGIWGPWISLVQVFDHLKTQNKIKE